MFVNQAEVERRVQAAQLERAKRDCIAAVYQKFPLIVRCEASERMLLEAVKMFAGWDVVPTYDLFLSALDENPEIMSTIATRSEERTRQQLIEDILALWAAKGKGHDEFTLRIEGRRLATIFFPALWARGAE